ncbi:Ribonuclease D [Pseudoalteromonas carrageenovora]|uniref:Ribonuclease D n=1 Tax=Pseudoalteromonas carrageenovora IAM 12662 TaxID=1314868 RepID=A0A2K4XFR2_PSEVC|nr:ribonuclease D [Pseudoalteromonas carrageenovora]MBE0384761.1 ribonuclease D [Pseudoalteromonas carrageenovora IAM 12662]QBJ73419.1 Ribonuclease D [Pseudoalteromonas carrageenovora]GEB69442.1 ribonuclease D [Pseudoalteromonas carrageenovora]SOU43141.1 ribonuclease D [Pseudoalteromonas carrageenovora IAM 12662]
MQYQLIETQNQLNTFVEQIKSKPILAIDTEFMRRRTLYPEVALIQVFDGEHLALIDPLAELSLFDFWEILKDPAVLKVLHSPSEDIEVFQKYAGFVPAPLFDTQFALQLLGEGNCMGFALMVKELLEIEIDKSESRTNWLQRPLTKKQLDYAAADTFHLLPCYELIIERINKAELFDIVINESELIANKRAFQTPDELLYKDIKNAWQLKPHELAVLKELAVWRRNKAIRKNLALNFVLKEHNMTEIAKRGPSSLNSLRQIPGVESMEVNRSGVEILKCIETAKATPEELHPPVLKRLIDFPSYKKVAKDIKQKVTKVAKEHNIPEDVMASKKQINQLISWNWKLTDVQKQKHIKPDLLSSWRYSYVKETLKEWDK